MIAPWGMSKRSFNTFTKVTENNRKEVLVLGRILYHLEISGKYRQYRGFFEIDPRMVKGRFIVKNHVFYGSYNAWNNATETSEEYRYRFKPILKTLEEGRLYYRETDPLVKYSRA